ncbi:TauD/TfdA dioxygenase family protein [Leeia aquatica]|uniref:Taurine dioxygenase n=1 Tax=Leeia aquatica TaxID=2725557 RepID=A0A847S220_9NEIS|nr:TauD/TfdA family dioxygenase [Leeia aquatica]NLR73774.1 taurine dioxygenase [Leeia aquatica]
MSQFVRAAVEKITTAPTQRYETLGVQPLTPIIGAEVSGVDLSRPLEGVQLAELKRAFLRHHVLVFRDQHIQPDDQRRFAQYFGSLKVLPISKVDGGDPNILDITASKDSEFVVGTEWHTDGTAEEAPSLGSILYIKQTPALGAGGDTLFANMHLAYEMLSPAMRQFLDGLTAMHDGIVPWREYGYEPPEGLEIPRTEHPVVVRHPETGRKLLYVNSGFTTHIVQLAPPESKPLLDMLIRLPQQEPILSCRVRWQPNTVVLWDNRCTQHHAVWDYYPFDRFGQRVTIEGSRPTA